MEHEKNSKQFDVFFEKGINFFSIGKYHDALIWFDRTLEINPNNIGSMLNKANILANLNEHQESLVWFDKVLAIEPDNVMGLHGSGLSFYQLGKYREAISRYDKVIQLEPENINALYDKAIALVSLEKYYEAIFWFDKVLAIEPDNISTLNKKGETLSYMDQFKDAIACVDKALSISPDKPFSLYLKGKILLQLGSYQEALIWLEKAEKIAPDYPAAPYGKGVALLCLKAYDEAIACFDKALEMDPYNPAFIYIKQTAIKLKNEKQDPYKFHFNRIEIILDIMDSKSMSTHHTWIWEIVNRDSEPMDKISYDIQGDVPKDLTDLNVKIKDENNAEFNIITELNLPYMKKFLVKLNKPLLKDEKKVLRLEYDWEEIERYFYYELHNECNEFKWVMRVPKELQINPTMHKINTENGERSKTLDLTSTPVNNGKEIQWAIKPIIHHAYRFEW